MAQKTIVQLVDDLDGKELKEGDGQTVTFALEGIQYELDLSSKNADKFRGLFQDYISVARRVGGRKRSGSPAKRDASQTKAVRDWAVSQGYEISSRGRIPADVEEAYQAAHK